MISTNDIIVDFFEISTQREHSGNIQLISNSNKSSGNTLLLSSQATRENKRPQHLNVLNYRPRKERKYVVFFSINIIQVVIMKILITGASGFIGQKLIRDLQNNSETELYALSRHFLSIPNLHYIYSDVLDEKNMEELFKTVRFDVVIHLAAITAHREIVDNRLETLNTNLQGTINLLNNFNTYCKGGLFLYASTGKVYGKTNEMPISEAAIVNPQNILGKSKFIAERIIDFYAIPENKYLICRIFNIYGENQKRNFVVPTIIDQLKLPAITLGNLNELRDYLYIDDLLSALIACIYKGDGFSRFDYVNIGKGEPACVADILRELEELLGRKLNVIEDRSRFRKDETQIEFCDHNKLTSITGWKPRYSLKEGLFKTLKGEGILN